MLFILLEENTAGVMLIHRRQRLSVLQSRQSYVMRCEILFLDLHYPSNVAETRGL